jgi:hypothetical protein
LGPQCPRFIVSTSFQDFFGSVSWGIQCFYDIRDVVVSPSNRSLGICGGSVIFELWALVPRITLIRPGMPPYCLNAGFLSPELLSLGHQRLQVTLVWSPNLRANSLG